MRAYLIAGEPSGDRLGGSLIAELRRLVPGVEVMGIGGDEMQARGLQSLFPMSELSVMGIAEILPKYRALRRRLHQTAEDILARRPDVLITIDSPDFCLRVARLVRQRARIHTVHYVAPSVWAWRPGRAARMAPHVDQVLAILPFEPPYMRAAGMRCDFVGHPVVAEPVATDAEVRAFRAAEGLGDAPVLLVLPGSRGSEVGRLLPPFGEAVARVIASRPGMRVMVPAVAPVAEEVRAAARHWAGSPVVLDPRGDPAAGLARKRAAFRAADVALAASGTVSLELAAAGTPMVIAYDMNWLSYRLMRRMALIDTVTLVNIVTESRVVPEFLGPDCRPGPIAAALAGLLDRGPARDEQIAAMAATMQALGRGGEAPGLRAARAVVEGLAASRAG